MPAILMTRLHPTRRGAETGRLTAPAARPNPRPAPAPPAAAARPKGGQVRARREEAGRDDLTGCIHLNSGVKTRRPKQSPPHRRGSLFVNCLCFGGWWYGGKRGFPVNQVDLAEDRGRGAAPGGARVRAGSVREEGGGR